MHRVAHKRRRTRALSGLTLVEVAALVSVLGMVLAVAIPTLARTIRASKVAEASEQLAFLTRAALAYYAQPRVDPQHGTVHCLPDPAGPAPTAPSVSSVVVDFSKTTGAPTWKALRFAPSLPLRYRYSFVPAASGCWSTSDPRSVALTIRAEGDLDGDGVYSTFERRAIADDRGKLGVDPVLHIYDRIE